VAARHSELVDLQYWGDDHRAFVFPTDIGQRWTLVTFYDKDLIRTVNVEWLIITLVLLPAARYLPALAALGLLTAVLIALVGYERSRWQPTAAAR